MRNTEITEIKKLIINYKYDENKKRAEVSDMKYFSKKSDKFIRFFIFPFRDAFLS